MSRIDLLLPGLIPPAACDPREPVPQLESLLTRADRRTRRHADIESQLLALFRHPDPEAHALAPYTRLADLSGSDDDCWMRADPVSLRADLADILLFDATRFDLSGEEADRLLAELNSFFHEEPWELLRGADAKRWYLRLQGPVEIETTPLGQVRGRTIGGALPRGRMAGYWRRIGNEIQMLLHQHPLNQEREARGQPPVNGLWFWGQGPRAPVSADYQRVYADDPLGRGLAVAAGIEARSLNDPGAGLAPEGDRAVLLVSSCLQEALADMDFPAWQAALETLLAGALGRVLRAWQAGHVDAVNLYTGDDCFHAARSARWRLWRRKRGLSAWR